MKLNRRYLILTAAAALVGAAQAQPTQGVSDTEIVIGTHIDLSGPAAAGMPMLRNGMQLRIDELNAAGGVHGRKIKLIVEDNASQPQQAVRAVQKLLKSDNVFAILNPFGSGPTAATVKMSTDAGVMVFAPWAASGIIQKVSGNSPLLFTTVQNYDTTTANGLGWALKNWKSQGNTVRSSKVFLFSTTVNTSWQHRFELLYTNVEDTRTYTTCKRREKGEFTHYDFHSLTAST